MAGPQSLPHGGRKEYEEMMYIVCNMHRECTPDSHREFDKHGEPIVHEWITHREWLLRRNRLRTGKTA